MSCLYENRCLNGHACFRCFNNKLLKLNEDIIYKGKANSFVDKKKSCSNESWKTLEEEMVNELQKVPTFSEVRRTRGSGNQWFEKGDVLHSILKLECKERKGFILKGGDKSISIKKSWLEKAELEAREDNRIMALPFRFKEDETNYIILESYNIIELVNRLKAYEIENSRIEQELKFLKKKEYDILKNKRVE